MNNAPQPSTSDLLLRARRALESAAATTLALAPLAMQPAQAATLGTGDLVVDHAGAYFYNASGYFADWNGRPDGGGQATVNADGSTKLSGTVSASPAQFLAHQCGYSWGCSGYEDRGVALVWSGTLARPAAVGDRLAITVDFSITLPDTGGVWSFGAQLAGYDLSGNNALPTYGSSATQGTWISEAGTYRVHGTVVSEPLADWQLQPDQPVFWRINVTGTAGAPYGERAYSSQYGAYLTPYRAITLTVPEHSIDVAHVDASFTGTGSGLSVSAVPEPATWASLAMGLGLLALRARRRA